MSDDRQVLKAAADLLSTGEPFVLITIVGTQGSTPRNAGARMIWRPTSAPTLNGHVPSGHAQSARAFPNGSTGTVGGGQFEHLVLEAAQTCFEKRSHKLERFVLGADADQCCGGVVDVFLEYHGRPATLVLFGAGHVSHALAQLLAASPLQLAIVDDRAEWNSPERFPNARRVLAWEKGVALAHQDPGATLAVVMTCSHDTDFDLLRQLLVKPLAFTGLIGSRSKRACLFSRLVASGLSESAVQSVHCPVGVGDTGKEPHAVAISMAAQLLMEAKSLAQ